ncbi:TPA: AAA family ATPase [Photobacterium damselae]
MINELYIENYKSFKKGNFTFPNLTFFVGANSCGKSSITNLLLLLSQSLDSSFDFDTILRLNGKHIGFGDDLNIIKDHNVDNKVTISWSIEYSKEEYNVWSTQDIIDDFYHTFLYNDSVIRRLYRNNKKSYYTTKSSALRADAESQYYRNVEDIYSSNLLSILKSQQVLISKINKNDDKVDKDIKNLLRRYSSARLKDLLQFIGTRDHLKMQPSSLKLVLRYNSNTNEVEVEEHSISNISGDKIISFIFNPTGKIDVTSDIIDAELLKRSRRDIVKGISKNSILLSNFSSSFTDVRNHDNPFASYCLSYVNQATY